MTKLAIVSMSLAAAFGLTAQAQSQYPNQEQSQSQGQSQNAQSSQDAQFVQQASEANLAEVQLGKLGAQSQNSQIKQLGQHLESSHQSANQQLQSIAQNQGFQVSQRVSPHYRKQIQQLQGLSGKEFDKQFAVIALMDHGKAVDLFQKEAQQGQNPQLKQYAQKMLPNLQQHFQMAQSTARNVGVSDRTIAALVKQYPQAMGGAEIPGGQGQGAGSSQGGQDQMQQQQSQPYKSQP